MSERYEYSIENFMDCLRTGYVDSSFDSDARYTPRFVTNNSASNTSLLAVLSQQLRDCDSFDIAVAFISDGGLQALIELLNVLRDKGIQGRLLTSTYLNFNKPASLEKLLRYSNLETRVYEGNLHAKGYLFKKGSIGTAIIGSSNLTQTALKENKEWNILFQSYENGAMLESARREFETLWESPNSVSLSTQWIDSYRQYLASTKERRPSPAKPFASTRLSTPVDHAGKTASHNGVRIVPNTMQSAALKSLKTLHEANEPRALLVSATGTGKTYLSALDVLQAEPSKVLFIAHRKRILEASKRSFMRVLGSAYTYELYAAGSAKPSSSCVFAMSNTLVRHLDEFDPDEFDYVIIDEAHRAGAETYRKIIDHFRPSFLFGMTATPSRTDSYDVFELFNHKVAFRITLQDALRERMLVPFHYFGIADLEIDDQTIDDPSLFGKLTSTERIRHVSEKIEEYTIDKDNRRGLIFCNRNEEASVFSECFNAMGYRTVALSGKDSDDTRNRYISMLESGKLEYIFTVDIFNEGIDIPSLNQIIMLRRTESPIVFVQQLGRGLRLYENKEYTLVLDFIGNYQQNYFIPIALSGDRTYNKDTLRNFVKEGSSSIPGCSTINFDSISERKIFRALEGSRFCDSKLIRDEYLRLKQIVGAIPSLIEFDRNEALDPIILFKKFGSYHEFLYKYEPDYRVTLSNRERLALKFVSQKLSAGKRPVDLALLNSLIKDAFPKSYEPNDLRLAKEPGGSSNCAEALQSAIRVLSGAFAPISSKEPDFAILSSANDKPALSSEMKQMLQNEAFRSALLDVVQFGLHRSLRYANTYADTSFVLWEKYTYEEVCRLLNWDQNVNGQNLGGYKYDKKTNTFPVFINYDKDPSISDTIKYEDRFISDQLLVAISKQPRNLKSPEIQRLKEWSVNGIRVFLFIRKNKNDKDPGGKEFYFFGEMHPTGQFREFTMPNTTKTAVEITYRLNEPVRADLFDYITSDFQDQ